MAKILNFKYSGGADIWLIFLVDALSRGSDDETGVSILPYLGISIPKQKLPILVDFIKNWVHFIKNSDVISLVIDQSQPGVFNLQKMMNFMKPGVIYLQK